MAQAEGAGAGAAARKCGKARTRTSGKMRRPPGSLECGGWEKEGRPWEGRLGPAWDWSAKLRNLGFIPQAKVVLGDLVLTEATRPAFPLRRIVGQLCGRWAKGRGMPS